MRLDDEEVNKLLAAIALMATAKPNMVLRMDDPVGMAVEVVDEVNRLRVALRRYNRGSMKASSAANSAGGTFNFTTLIERWAEDDSGYDEWAWPKLKDSLEENNHGGVWEERENERLRESIGAWREYVEEAMSDVEILHYKCRCLRDKLESWLYPDGGVGDETKPPKVTP